MDLLTINKAYVKIRAINHPLRRQIIECIIDKTEINVTDLHELFNIQQSVMSSHLSILRKQGFLKTYRQGKCIYYSVNEIYLKEIHDCILEITKN